MMSLQLDTLHLKQIIKSGDIEKLEFILLEGQGKKLIGEYSADYRTRTFIKSVPALMSKISLLHDAVNSGRLEELQSLLDEEPEKKKRLVLAKDEAGVGLLHKAVYYDLKDIAKYLIENYPQTVHLRDADGRTAYHYTPMCRDKVYIQKLLKYAGADPGLVDYKQHTSKYYNDHPSELELPSPHKTATNSRKSTATRESLVIKKSNIRIWIHQRNLANLQQVVWEGHGSKLLVEHSTNARVRKFLEAVPQILNLIKETHIDIQTNDVNALEAHVNDVPPILLTGKDVNGLTPLHKAAGLGYHDIARYIVEKYPKSVLVTDNEGRTPLHYASMVKDGGEMFDYLLSAGADESALDNRQKTAAFYRSRSNEIDGKLLQVVPDCPRTAKTTFPTNWDWSLINNGASTETTPKAEKKITDIFGNTTEAENAKTEIEELKNEKTEVAEEVIAAPKEDEDKELVTEEEEEQEPHEEESKENEMLSNDSGIEKEENGQENDTEEIIEGNIEEPNEESNEDAPESPEDVKEDEEDKSHHSDKELSEDGEIVDHEEPQDPPEEIVEDNPTPPKTPPIASTSNENSPTKTKNDDEANEDVVGVIEGVVNGENEVESVNEEGSSGNDQSPVDPEIATLIESGNMEQLASLVLNGHGDKLVGQKSENGELQAFLDNVSIYMAKINRIHVAARNGTLKELQAALDRRKFAIAKDEISPDGATPLHVATIFGNTSIVRYLAGRFPETVTAVDDDGRTSLHYAATVADNGHYYNLLVHLGADARAQDNFDHTPDYYRTNQDEFSHRMLLQKFGAEDSVLEEMLNDKVPNDIYSARKNLDDEDMIAVLDKCYNVLHGRRSSNASSAASVKTISSTTSTMSQFQLSKHVRKYTYDLVKFRMTKMNHNLYDLIWPSVKKLPMNPTFRLALEQDFPAGIVAPDCYTYKVFKEFIEPIVKDVNCIDIHSELKNHPKSIFCSDKSDNFDIETDLDPHSKNILAGTLDCTRNLENYDFPKCLNLGQLEKVERIITTVLLSAEMASALYPNATKQEIIDKGSGTYYTMNEVLEEPSDAKVILASSGLLIPLWNIVESDRLHGKHWPYGRGVFISNAGNFVAWINVLDHIRIVTCTPQQNPGNIGRIFSRIYRTVTVLEKYLSFHNDDKFGYISARPTVLGNTLQFNLTVSFPYLIKEPDNLRHLCLVRGLYFNRTTLTNDIVKIGNQQCLGLNELQTFGDFATAVANILQLEKDLAMSNSMHIATLFVNMFRRKKSTINE